MSSLVEAFVHAIDKAATKIEVDTGRGKASADKINERIGISKGMREAIEIIKRTAKAVNSEDE